MKNNRMYFDELGKIKIEGPHGERSSSDPTDSDFVGGGYKIVPVLKKEGDEYSLSQEIVNTAAGAWFSDNRSISIYGIGNQNFKTPISERMTLLDECYRLWKYDPLGGIIINLTTFFVLGRGITVNYKSEINNKYLKKFWEKNSMDIKSKTICDESTAYGENFIVLKVHKKDIIQNKKIKWRAGDVEVYALDPKVIDAIEHTAENVNDVIKYHVSYVGENDMEIRKEINDISRFNPEIDTECIIHVKFNASNSDAFGSSDLVRIKEWLDNYQDFLRDGVIINKLYRSPCYDITIKDGDDADILAAQRRYSNWRIGSNPVHNDKEEWKVLEFTGANVSQENSRRALLLIIAAGVGLPEYMLADGSNANLASTKSQQLPAIKRFEDYQDKFICLFKKIFGHVLEMKFLFGKGQKPTPEIDFEGDSTWPGEIKLPEIVTENDSVVAEYTGKLVEKGMISKSSALTKNGMNYDNEIERIQKDFDKSIVLYQKIYADLKLKGLTENEAKIVAISIVFPSPQPFTPEVKVEPTAKPGKKKDES